MLPGNLHKDDTLCSSVKGGRQGPELFLTCCVPQQQLDSLGDAITHIKGNILDCKVNLHEHKLTKHHAAPV